MQGKNIYYGDLFHDVWKRKGVRYRDYEGMNKVSEACHEN